MSIVIPIIWLRDSAGEDRIEGSGNYGLYGISRRRNDGKQGYAFPLVEGVNAHPKNEIKAWLDKWDVARSDIFDNPYSFVRPVPEFVVVDDDFFDELNATDISSGCCGAQGDPANGCNTSIVSDGRADNIAPPYEVEAPEETGSEVVSDNASEPTTLDKIESFIREEGNKRISAIEKEFGIVDVRKVIETGESNLTVNEKGWVRLKD